MITASLVLGTIVLLSSVALLPELFDKHDDFFWRAFSDATVPVQSQEDFNFAEEIALYGDFWFKREEMPQRNVWRRSSRKRSKCGWNPLPPGTWNLPSLAWS